MGDGGGGAWDMGVSILTLKVTVAIGEVTGGAGGGISCPVHCHYPVYYCYLYLL